MTAEPTVAELRDASRQRIAALEAERDLLAARLREIREAVPDIADRLYRHATTKPA